MFPNTYSILLVEDNPADARMVQLALDEVSTAHFQVSHVDSLDSALDVLAQGRFDAVLLDLSLPDSLGLETLEHVSQIDPAVPVVVFSGNHDEELALQAVQHGAQDYLVKGHGDGYVISRVVRYAMERKRSEEALRQAREELERRVDERTANLSFANLQLQREVLQRQQAEKVLRESEERFRLLVENVMDHAIFMISPDGLVASWNTGAERLKGYSADQIVGRPFELFFPEREVRQGRPGMVLEAARLKGQYEFEGWRQLQGGGAFWGSVIITSLFDEQGHLQGYSCVTRDITERRLAEERERKQLAELAHISRLSTMGEMATEIAHELNQPLAAIATYSNACVRFMESETVDRDEIIGAMKQVRGQAERASEIISRMRDFLRKQDGRRDAVGINELVESMVRLSEAEARFHHVKILTDLAPEAAFVRADRILIEQVILNLLRNAIEAMDSVPPENRRLHIATRNSAPSLVEVRVQDSGPGLAGEAVNQVFERFYTTKPQGMGMGLAICRSIVEAHEGTLWAERGEPGGAVFRFRLPTCHEGAAAANA